MPPLQIQFKGSHQCSSTTRRRFQVRPRNWVCRPYPYATRLKVLSAGPAWCNWCCQADEDDGCGVHDLFDTSVYPYPRLGGEKDSSDG